MSLNICLYELPPSDATTISGSKGGAAAPSSGSCKVRFILLPGSTLHPF